MKESQFLRIDLLNCSKQTPLGTAALVEVRHMKRFLDRLPIFFTVEGTWDDVNVACTFDASENPGWNYAAVQTSPEFYEVVRVQRLEAE